MSSQNKITDQDLVARAQQGDHNAYGLLVGRYQQQAIGLAYRWTKNSDDAKEIAQESFIRGWRALGKFRGDSAFYTWLFRIVSNTAYGWIKKNYNRTVNLEDDEWEFGAVADQMADTNTPDKLAEYDETTQVLQKLMAKLPENQRQTLVLRELQGLNYEDISKIMGVPIGTVRSRIFRARAELSEKYNEWRNAQ